MLVLAIDTATAQVGVALGSPGVIHGEVRLSGVRRHAEQLAPAIRYLLEEHRAVAGDLTGVAVGIGPGLFTGLRVGVTTAKVLAQSLRLHVVPVSSLDLLAYPHRFAQRLVVSVIDAKRGEVFCAAYRQVPGGMQRVWEPRVCSPAELAAELEADRADALLVGDGALAHREQLAVARVEVAGPVAAHPSPGALLQLAIPRFEREEFVAPWDVRPMYLRAPDAVPHWEQR
jgi:tRNA threonylcarbamoyladenosine biosynthesis protein TsaB